ncbi:MAG: DUF3667 domain-containing protein [Muribaculaceae bacterium]|nr:DUF3667 domain-containing protein [Muribaculaceae bacterium]
MQFKQRLKQFREWQREPFQYVNHSQGPTRCANCGTEFDSNYCPMCAQKAGVGRVGWKTVRQGIMFLWGMDSRSLSYTIVQLLLRPGYLISDYISGKRQVSFPPVKMLFLIAIPYLLVRYLLERYDPTPNTPEANMTIVQSFVQWVKVNPGWGFLIISCFMIFPTWAIFRYAKRNYHHTLPEGFFIQVYMSTLLLLFAIIVPLTTHWLLWGIPIYYFVTYKQLFGYGWWGTLWRTAMCIFDGFILMMGLICLYSLIIKEHNEVPGDTIMFEIGWTFGLLTFGAVAALGIMLASRINRKTSNSAKAQNSSD